MTRKRPKKDCAQVLNGQKYLCKCLLRTKMCQISKSPYELLKNAAELEKTILELKL